MGINFPFLGAGIVHAALVVLLVAFVVYALVHVARIAFAGGSTRTVAYAVVLAAIAAALGQLSIPLPLGAKPAPAQHMVNVLAAVLLGPWWAVLVAFTAAVIRNALGSGSPLAFPGGMIGALLAGLAWRATRNIWAAAAGEIVGTGILAALVSAALVAPAIMGREMAMTALVVPFLLSTVVGTAIGVAALFALRSAGVLPPEADDEPARAVA
jgi:energy-coupling factor transport system ATP-binding protein